MSGLVGQHQIATFTTPVNGTSPIDANQVRGNDNTIKTYYDLHDNDATIHFQSNVAASRPSFGVPDRKWIDSDTFRVYFDTGSAWQEIAYLGTGGGTATGPVRATRLIASTDISGATAFVVASDGTAPSSNGASITVVNGFASSSASAVTNNTVIGSENILKQTVANSGADYALRGYGWAAHTSGSVSQLHGVQGIVETGASGGTVTNADALSAFAFVPTGATVTNLRMIQVIAPVGSGTITNSYGLFIGNMGSGSTNFAMQTGTGLVQFGDNLILAASTTSRSSVRIPAGTAPSSPIAGETWNDGTYVTVYAGLQAQNGKIGYATGTGGTVTQLTNKSTGVALNTTNGQITMSNAALGAGATVSFILTNSQIAANDTVVPTIQSGATSGAYTAFTTTTSNGSCEISIRNVTGGALGEAVKLNFTVFKNA